MFLGTSLCSKECMNTSFSLLLEVGIEKIMPIENVIKLMVLELNSAYGQCAFGCVCFIVDTLD